MPAPTPATDAQLQDAAQHGVQVWTDQTQQAFDQQWGTAADADRLLAGLPAGARRQLWAGLLRPIVDVCRHDIAQALMQHRDELRAEAFSLLQGISPRATDQDLRGGPAEKMLVDTVAATAAGRDVAATTAAAGARIQEFADRAAAVEQVRASKQADLADAYSRMSKRLDHLDLIRGLAAEYADATTLLTMIGPGIWTACDSARSLLASQSKAASDADRALIAAAPGTLRDQQAAMAGPFDAAAAAVSAADAALTTRVDALAESAVRYLWGNFRPGEHGPIYR